MRLEVELAEARQQLGRMEELERELQKYRWGVGWGGERRGCGRRGLRSGWCAGLRACVLEGWGSAPRPSPPPWHSAQGNARSVARPAGSAARRRRGRASGATSLGSEQLAQQAQRVPLRGMHSGGGARPRPPLPASPLWHARFALVHRHCAGIPFRPFCALCKAELERGGLRGKWRRSRAVALRPPQGSMRAGRLWPLPLLRIQQAVTHLHGTRQKGCAHAQRLTYPSRRACLLPAAAAATAPSSSDSCPSSAAARPPPPAARAMASASTQSSGLTPDR